MDLLPPEKSILKNQQVLLAFHQLFYQVKDQAKAAIKNNLAFKGDRIGWILIVGPYWTKQTYGPFTEAKLERHDRRLSNAAKTPELRDIQLYPSLLSTPNLALVWGTSSKQPML